MNTFYELIIPVIFGTVLLTIVTLSVRHRRRLRFINSYTWPPGLLKRLKHHHPHLTSAEIDRIDSGLRQFFRAYLNGGLRSVAMPSQAADDLWHEFILYTKAYDSFCQQAFGRFLHHTPSAVLKPKQKASNEGLRRVWWHCCKEEKIDPLKPSALPLLFALDADLKIPNGYHYTPDCKTKRKDADGGSGGGGTSQCASDFSDSSIDGGTDGLGDGGSGDGGGCGGD